MPPRRNYKTTLPFFEERRMGNIKMFTQHKRVIQVVSLNNGINKNNRYFQLLTKAVIFISAKPLLLLYFLSFFLLLFLFHYRID